MSMEKMTSFERRAAYTLSSIFALRMLGMFMILPVFAIYAKHLSEVTPQLVGDAIGIYGLSQALLGIPFGMLSDRLGRKPVIVIGLVIFAIGSAVAAMSTSIYGVIAGRAIQGAGAISAVVMALLADLTREEQRTKAMAVIGMTIGLSFMVAMVAGPVLNHLVGVPGIFWLTGLSSLLAIGVVLLLVPTSHSHRLHRDAEVELAQFGRVFRNGELMRLNFGIMALHMGLAATFTSLPLVLVDSGFLEADHWKLYLPVMMVGMIAAIPFIIIAEKRRMLKQIFIGAIALMVLSESGLTLFYQHFNFIVLSVGAYFIAFNLLEATLPSLVAKFAPAEGKGTAMGLYSSAQFIGVFLGGRFGGWFHAEYGYAGVFAFATMVILLWLLLAATMRQPRYLSSQLLYVGEMELAAARQAEMAIAAVRGVAEVTVEAAEGVAYLKVDNHALDRDALEQFCAPRP